MKSPRAFPPTSVYSLTILFCILALSLPVSASADTTVTFGDNTVAHNTVAGADDFPGTVEDAMIPSEPGYRDYNYGAITSLHVGSPNTSSQVRRAFIRFRDIASSIGPDQAIVSATMYLYCHQEASGDDFTTNAYRVLLNWVEGNSNGPPAEPGAVCGNDAQYGVIPWNLPGCSEANEFTGEDSTADRRATPEASTLIDSTGWFAWDLTTAVQAWYDGEYQGQPWSEYGVILISEGEFTANSVKQFASSENVNDGYRPYLEVTHTDAHTVSQPDVPAGIENRAFGYTGTSYMHTAEGSTCSYGHSLEYQFDWGDGPYSDWGSGTECHAWTSIGTYEVRVQARCEQGVLSEWSDPFEVEIIDSCPISLPDAPIGETSGETGVRYTYTAGGSSCSNGHDIYYQFNWGDENYSYWYKESSPSTYHAWSEAGTYEVKVRAGCRHGDPYGPITSITDWSAVLTVNISSGQSGGTNLEVPIEMVDYGLASRTTSTAFTRSAVALDPDDYDGATYYFEIVASNADLTYDYDVTLMEVSSEPDVEMVTITVPAGTDIPTRMGRVSSFDPTLGGYKQYRVRLEGTTPADQLKVYTARIIVVQKHATRTRIQIPLLQEGCDATTSSLSAVLDQTSSVSYSHGDPDKFTIWAKDNAVWGDIASGNAWTFEAVLGSTNAAATAYASLFNKTTGAQVVASEVSRSGAADPFVTEDFSNGAGGFGDADDGDEFEVRHRISNAAYASVLSRACLYVKLTDLKWGEVYWRVSKKLTQTDTSEATYYDYQRTILNTLNNYSNPSAYHEATGWGTTEGYVDRLWLYYFPTDSGVDDSGDRFDGDLEFYSSDRQRVRSKPSYYATGRDMILEDGRRVVFAAWKHDGVTQVTSAWLVVKFHIERPVYTVCKDGSCDHDSITDAVADAQATNGAGIVSVTDSGTYNCILYMSTYIDVISTWDPEVDPPGDRPTIESAGDTVQFSNPAKASGQGVRDSTLEGFIVRATNCCWNPPIRGGGENITIRNCYVDLRSDPTGQIVLWGGQVTIEGCTVKNASMGGITSKRKPSSGLSGGSHVVIKGCTISGCNLAGIALKGEDPGVTVVIGGSGADQNIVQNNGHGGIVCDNISDVVIDNNIINNNALAGIALLNVGGEAPAIVRNNVIYGHSDKAGINVVGSSRVIIGDNNEIHDNYAGVAFAREAMTTEVVGGAYLVAAPSSEQVVIQNNHIYSNTRGGIAVLDRITGPLTITGNHIEQNIRGGINLDLSYTNSCEFFELGDIEITNNDIHDNDRAGIRTSGGAFPTVNIRGNKVYGNGSGTYGGGIDVRHAYGTIENNLVYKNQAGGIRFGDLITDIINNTVVSNGFNNAFGGGIIYTDQTGDLVLDPPSGDPSAPLLIRNNICAYNEDAGLGVCFTNTEGSEERDYNLVHGNHPYNHIFDRPNPSGCNWPNLNDMSCVQQQYGGCGAHFDFSQSPFIVLNGPHDMMDDPDFSDKDNDDYHLNPNSPAEGAGDDFTDLGCYGGQYPITW